MKYVIEEIKKEIGFAFPKKTVFLQSAENLKVECKNQVITVLYKSKRDILRAALIVKANGNLNDYCIEEKQAFEEICLMVDCSRNAVRNIDTVKKLIRNMAMMGYSSLMLYTEDTYEVDNEPLFGYLRGRYTKAELKELNAYANELGIEMIPCIQTLAHLNQLLRYKYSHFQCFDCADILLIGSNRTYELIENMFKTLAECYTSRTIHIGMDEAHLVGRGKYLDINGYALPFEILLYHLNKVCDIAKKYGFKPIVWGDMFYNFGKRDKRFLNENGVTDWAKIVSFMPKNLSLCYWDYHFTDPSVYKEKLGDYLVLDENLWFAGGTSEAIRGFVPHLTYSCKVAEAAIAAAKERKVKRLLETVWGDNGGECSLFAQLPTIMHYPYTANGISKDRLKTEFLALTGYAFEDFMHIEDGETFCGQYTNDLSNPTKCGLYNDPFLGYVDAIILPEDKQNFFKAAKLLTMRTNGQYKYIFQNIYNLNQVLALKYDIGIRLRTAYQAEDKKALQESASDLEKIIVRLEKYINSYQKQWLIENKPSGLEIQEIRLGGLKTRLMGCKKRLNAYLRGKVKNIPELEESLLPEAIKRVTSKGRCDLFSHEAIASVNAFDGFTEVDV